MFENFKNMASMLGQAKQVQEKFEAMQQELATKTVEADAGAGAVRVVANGKLEIQRIHLDRAMLQTLAADGDDLDQRMIEDLIAAATNAALSKARDLIQQECSRMAGGLNLPAMADILGLNKG